VHRIVHHERQLLRWRRGILAGWRDDQRGGLPVNGFQHLEGMGAVRARRRLFRNEGRALEAQIDAGECARRSDGPDADAGYRQHAIAVVALAALKQSGGREAKDEIAVVERHWTLLARE